MDCVQMWPMSLERSISCFRTYTIEYVRIAFLTHIFGCPHRSDRWSNYQQTISIFIHYQAKEICSHAYQKLYAATCVRLGCVHVWFDLSQFVGSFSSLQIKCGCKVSKILPLHLTILITKSRRWCLNWFGVCKIICGFPNEWAFHVRRLHRTVCIITSISWAWNLLFLDNAANSCEFSFFGH